MHRQDGPSQVVVDSLQAERLIAAGHRFVGILPNGRVVLQRNPDPK